MPAGNKPLPPSEKQIHPSKFGAVPLLKNSKRSVYPAPVRSSLGQGKKLGLRKLKVSSASRYKKSSQKSSSVRNKQIHPRPPGGGGDPKGIVLEDRVEALGEC